MMKRIIALILSLMMICVLALVAAEEKTVTAKGDSAIGGKESLVADVTFDAEGKITAIKIVENMETAGIADPALEKIPAAIIADQSVVVDSVSGATMTSEAIKMAVSNAITMAGYDLAAYQNKVEHEVVKAEDETLTADVVVIGAGGAGLAAAVQAHQNGASVLVIEKMDKVGGNTILAGGALNAVDDRSETAIANNDSVEWHYQQTLAGGDFAGDPDLVHVLVSKAWEGVKWLKDMGMEFKPGTFTVLGGLWPRAHKPVEPVGTGFFKTYMAYIDSHEGITLKFNTKAEHFITDESGRVVGVQCKGETGNTVTAMANKGVVCAMGGFGRNIEMRQAFNTQWATLDASIPSTNHPGATGDAVKMLMELGADMVQMGNIQLLPLGDPETGSLSGNIEFGVESRIFVNKEGKRFVDEGGRRDQMTAALFEQPDSSLWIIMDSDNYPTGEEKNNFNESVNSLIAAGRAYKGETLEDLARQIGVNYDNLKAALDDYNAHCLSKEADAFGRTLYGTPIDNGPFYAAARVPTVHHTMGGVRITTEAKVVNERGDVIPGLYAAGEVVGGIHGTNRLGGNALTDILVFGRIAGENAAAGK